MPVAGTGYPHRKIFGTEQTWTSSFLTTICRKGISPPDGPAVKRLVQTSPLMLRKLKKENVNPYAHSIHPVFNRPIRRYGQSLVFQHNRGRRVLLRATLLEHQADLGLSNYLLRPAYGQKQKNILFEMLKTAKRDKKEGFRIAFSKVVINGFIENLAIVVHMFREILNVDVAFGLFSHKNRNTCIVIAPQQQRANRCRHPSCAPWAAVGHTGAGSALVKAKPMDEIEEWILELLAVSQTLPIQVSDLMSFSGHLHSSRCYDGTSRRYSPEGGVHRHARG